jgi:subtilisin family serine protease
LRDVHKDREGIRMIGVLISAMAGLAAASDTDTCKLWVYLNDKGLEAPGAREAAMSRWTLAADARTLERRRLRRSLTGLCDETDLPVAAAYAAAIERTGARIHVRSAWLNAVSVRATPAQASALRRLSCVRQVVPVRSGRGSSERPGQSFQAGATDDFYGAASEQLGQIDLIALHARGFTGAGVRIGILDTGFKRSHGAFNHPGHMLEVVAEHDFVMGDGNTAPQAGDHPDQHTHGTLILGTLGAYKPNELVGAAYDASFILCKTEDVTSETPVEEDNYVAGLEFIESHGGDVVTASLIYSDWYSYSQFNGLTAPTTIAVNIATANGVYCCNAVGNAGHDANPAVGHIAGVPADAFKVLSIGAVEANGAIAGFSSDGPTADGRLKPEVLARGAGTSTISPSDDVNYTTASGTSLSTPLAAGAVACLAQARPWWTVDDMRLRLMTSAGDYVQNGQPDPLLVRGYGVIDADRALRSDCYANCDGSSAAPVLTPNDFQCFLNRFASESPLANCDGSAGTPTLTANDFQCFLNAYADGCS